MSALEDDGWGHVAPAAGARPQRGVSPEDTAAGSPPSRKRSRADTSGPLNQVRARLMERGVDGVDRKTSAPALVALLAQHGLITRATFPDPRYWKSGSGDQRNVSKFGLSEARRGWNAWLERGETAEQLARLQSSCVAAARRRRRLSATPARFVPRSTTSARLWRRARPPSSTPPSHSGLWCTTDCGRRGGARAPRASRGRCVTLTSSPVKLQSCTWRSAAALMTRLACCWWRCSTSITLLHCGTS